MPTNAQALSEPITVFTVPVQTWGSTVQHPTFATLTVGP